MAKVSRTKTHVKIYLTPIEVDAFCQIVTEGVTGLYPEQWTAAIGRVDRTVGEALKLADEITEQS